MNISIFGAGYVGLVQAAVLASVGHQVLCVDIDQAKVEGLNQGIMPVFEPGLGGMVRANLEEGRLAFSADLGSAVAHAQVQFIAVGTPCDTTGGADLSQVRQVIELIANRMDSDQTVINKSTVPVGTADEMRVRFAEILAGRRREDLQVEVIANPEFLKQGAAVADCQRPDRIIVGVHSPQGAQLLQELYAPFNRNHEKIVLMDLRSAELTKYAANAFLATKISFMNEMANLAEHFQADIELVRKGIGADQRIGYDFIYPGCGYGGSCFPKDVKALCAAAKAVGGTTAILSAVEAVNQAQKRRLLDKIDAHYGDAVAGKTFAVWGLAFKANTNDMREAPSRDVLEGLWARGARVQAFDPEAMDECHRLYGERPDLRLCANQQEALSGADALVVVTDWTCFKAPDFNLMASELADAVVFDGRNLYEAEQMRRHRLRYRSIGRPSSF